MCPTRHVVLKAEAVALTAVQTALKSRILAWRALIKYQCLDCYWD